MLTTKKKKEKNNYLEFLGPLFTQLSLGHN